MIDGKIPMPADGRDSPKVHSDGVGDDTTHGRSGGGESGGGSYDNPHTGKEARGESDGFDGGQSGKGYYGPGQLDGENADPDTSGAAEQGGDGAGADDGSKVGKAGEHEAHQVKAGGRTFNVVQASGVAEAEVNGKVGTDAAYEDEQKSPGSG